MATAMIAPLLSFASSKHVPGSGCGQNRHRRNCSQDRSKHVEVREAVIVGAVRTPVGRRGGALSLWQPVDLLRAYPPHARRARGRRTLPHEGRYRRLRPTAGGANRQPWTPRSPCRQRSIRRSSTDVPTRVRRYRRRAQRQWRLNCDRAIRSVPPVRECSPTCSTNSNAAIKPSVCGRSARRQGPPTPPPSSYESERAS